MSSYNEEPLPSSTGIKLFVGQIPREMDEDTLIPYFAEFGPIIELTVIRDRSTKIHKGCAFVTYLEVSSAHQAIEQLHDKIKLGHAINPLQVRIAECQIERENKLFIGMLPKTVSEEQLHDMFVKFGDLREVHIIRGPEGSSKGCAFVKFVERESALSAIDEMNNKIPDGSTRPLVIKFADVKKHGKKVDGMDYIPEHIQGNVNHSKESSYWMQQHQQAPSTQYYYPSYEYSHGGNIPLPQQMMQSFLPYGHGVGQTISSETSYMMMNSSSTYPQHVPLILSMENGMKDPRANGGVYGSAGTPQRYRDPEIDRGVSGFRKYISPTIDRYPEVDSSSPSTPSQRIASNNVEESPPSPTRPPEGPSGANLFIYHLPRDLTDADLATLFAEFGNVISAKVFVDKKTSDSKGFGFVSFDSIESADAAIAAMNGFQIGAKRLKVQHKREDSYSPNASPMDGPLPSGSILPASVMEAGLSQYNYMSNHMHQMPQAYMSVRPMMTQLVPTSQMTSHQYYQGRNSLSVPAAPSMPMYTTMYSKNGVNAGGLNMSQQLNGVRNRRTTQGSYSFMPMG